MIFRISLFYCIFSLCLFSCARKSTCPAANRISKEKPQENNTPFGASIKETFFRKKKSTDHNFSVKEQKANNGSSSLFSSAAREKTFSKDANLFASGQKPKTENTSGNLFAK